MTPDPARAALIKAEEQWARAWQGLEHGLVSSYFTEDALLLTTVRPPVAGRKAIEEFLARVFGLPGLETVLRPERAEVAGGGDLGYTVGSYETSISGSNRHRGSYLAAWRKHLDGAWRIAAYSSAPLDVKK